MKPGRRVSIIQAVVGQLWDWLPEKQVDLIFRQFGLGDPAAWRRAGPLPVDRYDALLRTLEALPDETLEALAEAVGPASQ